jgi:TRAP transporter TAXI family solute receptor
MAAAISDAMKKEKGVTMRVLPTGTDISRMSVIRLHRAHFAAVGMGLYMAQEGVYDFGTRDWGPQPIRVAVTNWAKAGMIYMTAKDANIKTWADSKGKRFAWIPGYAAANVIGTAMLAFAGLTWKDVVKVDLPSFGAAGKAVVDGKVDAACCATYSAFNYELAASPRGIHYPPLPFNDEAGWARLLAVCPYYAKMMCTDGAQLDAAHPYEGGTYPNSNVIFYSDTDAELVYNVTKLYQELYPVYSKSNAPGITGYALNEIKPYFSWAVPFHEGAIRYYKEAGAWTAENDKNNQKMLERQRVLQEAWDQAIIQSSEQKVIDANFPKFWMTMRQKALEKAGLPVVYYPE